jgi:arylsulfatase A-like enzyme
MGPLPLDEVTIPERLRKAGYMTGMIGKWHLEPTPVDDEWIMRNMPEAKHVAGGRTPIPFKTTEKYYPGNRGFTEFFKGEMNRYWANYNLEGDSLKPGGEWLEEKGYRLDIQTDAALAFIDRNKTKPFFLYLAYFAPHVPLEATGKYLSRFPGEMPERRRHCLAMMSAIDDGTGRILDALKKHDIDRNTLIFFISDNGAPLKIAMEDIPVSFPGGAWDGSLNTPWVGEKGMLSEGGIHVPYLMRWPGGLPAGKVYENPVSSLDVGATAVALAGLPADPALDGVNLIPFLTGEETQPPHPDLFWRFWGQSSVRSGRWKLLIAGEEKHLFDLESDQHERRDVLAEHPEIAQKLETRLSQWAGELKTPGLPNQKFNDEEKGWYDHYMKP